MKSKNMNGNIFERVPITKPSRNLFDLSFENRFSCKMGELIPFLCKPVVPGDTFKVNSEIFVRTAPLVSPMYQKMQIYTHYFYVPNRLICKDWEQFISPHATQSTPEPQELQLPAISGVADVDNSGKGIYGSDIWPDYSGPYEESLFDGTLFDFLNYHLKFSNYVGTTNVGEVTQSLLPINAYNLIYHEYYRDQNIGNASTINDAVLLNESLIYDLDWDTSSKEYKNLSGDDISTYFSIRKRCWRKDYFTSALPFTQRGADVHIPLYGDAKFQGQAIGGVLSEAGFGEHIHVNGSSVTVDPLQPMGLLDSKTINNTSFGVDLSSVSAATINELRRAIQLQKFLETSARVGGRYKEFVLGHFGVDINDGRLQRPEYLGGGVQPVTIGEVFQTSSTITSSGEVLPLADMAGRGSSYSTTNGFTHTFPEHGYIIGIMSIQPEAAYYQGIPRDLAKMDRLEFYTPEFAHLGEQGIYNYELYCPSEQLTESNVIFGYTPRYAEYKFSFGEIHGDFRNSLNTWHDARKFDETPTLSKKFLEVNEFADGLNRVFAVPGNEENPVEHFYCYVNHHISALRPMPIFGIPQF